MLQDVSALISLVIVAIKGRLYIMKIGSKVERFCASTVAVSSDSVSSSRIDHYDAVGRFRPHRLVGGESRGLGPQLDTGHRMDN